MRKFMKVISSIVLAVVVVSILAGFSYFNYITKNLALSKTNLRYKESSVEIYNLNNELINKSEYVDAYIEIDNIPKDVINAFISIEDKRFYKHNGVDYIRIVGATIKNIRTKELREGASTISQQLIKNTHLSSEKSIMRKLQEIKLARDLEKQYSKEDILEMYLNVIYFGNGIYGIENASQRFFNKSASDLSLSESAMLAGIVKNPSRYSPVINYSNSIGRRNLVLSLMHEQEYIDELSEQQAKNEETIIKYKPLQNNKLRPYIKSSIRQAADIMDISTDEVRSSKYRIYTYMDTVAQNNIGEKTYNTSYYKSNSNGYLPDTMCMLADNQTGGIIGYCSTANFYPDDILRQPGSAIKPISVYAPALEMNIISPATQILDEFTDFNGYAPKNYNDKYYGWISARDALAKSLNVPSVKILSYIGTDKSLDFMNKFGFNTDNEDSSLSLALGGTRNGATITQMTGAYCALANGGNYKHLSFVRLITDENGREIYRHNNAENRTMSEENAYLITDMLKTTVKNGTASKLNYLNIDIAAKTGTVSSNNSDCNTDAWSLSYTTEHTLCVWQGNCSNKNESMLDRSITGGSYPTMLARDIYMNLYRNHSPAQFVIPDSIVELEIDRIALQQDHNIMLISEFTPQEYRMKEIFSNKNQPIEVSEYFIMPIVNEFKVINDDNSPIIQFNAKKHIVYDIQREVKGEKMLIQSIKNQEGVIQFRDDSAPDNAIIKYSVMPYVIISDSVRYGEESNQITILNYHFFNKLIHSPE